MSSLSSETIDALKGIQSLGSSPAVGGSSKPTQPKSIIILDPDVLSALDLGKWAVEYAYKFTKTQYVHATAFNLGVEYVERKLAHVRPPTI